MIVSANNTDNLIKLIDQIVDNIKREDEMKMDKKSNEKYFKKQLFNTTYFSDMEYIFYKFIIPVGDKFAGLCLGNLGSYLKDRRTVVLLLVILLGKTIRIR